MDVDFVVMTHVLAFILVSQSGICIGSLLKFAIGGTMASCKMISLQVCVALPMGA